ncbi:hypothetical protein [Gemella morbillorum]
MDELFQDLIDEKITTRSPGFKARLEKANVINCTGKSLLDSAVLSEIEQINVYFALEYKLAYLMKNGTNDEIAHLNYLISNFLFFSLTPLFGKELATKYAEDACHFNSTDKDYKNWLENILNEKYIY